MARLTLAQCLVSNQNLIVDLRASKNCCEALQTSVLSIGQCSLPSRESFSARCVPFSLLHADGKKFSFGARACTGEDIKKSGDRSVEGGDHSKQTWDVSSNCVTPVFRGASKSTSSLFVDDSPSLRKHLIPYCYASTGCLGLPEMFPSSLRRCCGDFASRVLSDQALDCIESQLTMSGRDSSFPVVNSVDDGKLQILFLSEGNVCRSVLAEAVFADLLCRHNLQDLVKCSSKGVRDYNEGESPDPRVVIVAEECRLNLPEGKVSTVFDCASDIVNADLVLVFDKFNASDTLKEVTIHETVDKTSRHTGKVRRLGEFCLTRTIEDIEDPLYGNMGGPEELELIHEVLDEIRDSCEGLVQSILTIKSSLQGSETLKEGMKRSIGRMDALNWLVPPMLSRA